MNSRKKTARGPDTGKKRRGGNRDDETHIVVGRRFVPEAIIGGTIEQIWILPELRENLKELVKLAAKHQIPINDANRDELDRRSAGARHQGVVGLGAEFPYVSLDVFKTIEAPLLIALDEITDPHNLGAILRSALAFGADGAIIPKHRSGRITPVVVRSSAGASERSRIARVTNLQRALDELAEQGRDIVGLDAAGSTSIADLGPAPRGRVLVVGSEGSGLRRMVQKRCTHLARIPQLAEFDSLNASVASSIALYEAARARNLKS